MIFVTVGTTGFDALIECIDSLAPELPEKVITQLGPGTYVPRNCEYFRYTPSLTAHYERASVVISHGGLATITEVLNLGKPLIAIEDEQQADRHQREILGVWSRAGHLYWCRELTQLATCIHCARMEQSVPYRPPACTIDQIVQERIVDWFG